MTPTPSPSIRRHRHVLRRAAVVGALAIVGAACSSDDVADSEPSAPSASPVIATEPPPTATDDTAASGEEPSATDATDAAGEEPSATEPLVEILRSRFGPSELAVAAGTTVTFTNLDPFAHTVTARDDSPQAFDSGRFGEDESFTVTFDEPGTYAYFCEIHPTMRASVVVT